MTFGQSLKGSEIWAAARIPVCSRGAGASERDVIIFRVFLHCKKWGWLEHPFINTQPQFVRYANEHSPATNSPGNTHCRSTKRCRHGRDHDRRGRCRIAQMQIVIYLQHDSPSGPSAIRPPDSSSAFALRVAVQEVICPRVSGRKGDPQ